MSAPPKFQELFNTVEDYLTKGSKNTGWTIDAIEEPEDGKFQLFPFARSGNVGAHFIYSVPKSGLKVQVAGSSAARSWKDFLPAVSFEKSIDGRTHACNVDLQKKNVEYSYQHPTFYLTSRCAVADGLSSVFTATTRLWEKTYAGASASYDPKRSGLKDLTLLAVRNNCPNFRDGDIMAKYSLVDGLSLHLRVPVHTLMDVAVMAEKKRFIAGIQGRSPCGARVMLNTNVNDGTFTMTAIRNIGDIWKLTLTYTTGSIGAKAGLEPRFGLKFSNENMLE